MPLGDLQDEGDLERFIRRLLDRLGIQQSSPTIDSAGKSPFVQLDGGLGLVKVSQVFTITSPSGLGQGAEGDATLAHNLNITTPANCIVAGHLEDGAYANEFVWRVFGQTANSLSVRFKHLWTNNGPASQAVLRCRIIHD